jgi:hypothetical protein
MDPKLAAALGDVRWGDEATITYSRALGLDIMDWFGLPAVQISRRQVTVETTVDGDTSTVIWHTPAGNLREVIRVCRDRTGAVSSNRLEHLVKGPQDLPALAAIFADEVISLNPEGLQRTRQRAELIGAEGLLLGTMAGTPLGMMYRAYAGVETLAYLWADAPAALQDCLQVMEQNYQQQLALGVQSDVDAVVSVDDTSTTAISPAMFEACNMALTDQRAALAHAAGKLYFHHSCGLIRDLLPLYRQTQMDAVHAFTVPPCGNVTVAEGRKLLGDRITIIAGVQVLVDGPLEDREAVCEAIREMVGEGQGEQLILNVVAYPHRTMAQTRRVVNCCREIGGQPDSC